MVGLAAGAGAVARCVLDQLVQRRPFGPLPLGTLVVNVSGSLLLGLVTGLALHHGLPDGPTVVLSAGFCSGYTTWSTFSFETVGLAEAGPRRAAAANVVLSVALGALAAAAGLGLGLL